MTLDIAKNNCIVSHFQHVLRSSLTPREITHTQGRAWDGFCYILNGSCLYRFSDGTELTSTAGSLLYLARDSLYDMRIEEGKYESIYCDFLFEDDLPRQSAVFYPSDPSETEHRFFRMKKIFSIRDAGYVSECLALLYRIYADVQATKQKRYLPSPARQKMESARSTILEHYASDTLSVASLAEEAGMSEVYFRKLFRGQYGISPAQFIVQVRLSEAKMLLQNSELSLEEIALQCGFSTSSYFCRTFKEHTEQTPSEYRKSNPLIF